MTCSGGVIHWIGMDLFQWYGQFRQRPHTDKTDSCGPNDVFRRGYSLDWDGPVSLGSVNSGPVPTGRPTVLGLVYHELEILVVNGTNSAGNLWIKVAGAQWHGFCRYTRNK